MTMRFPIYLTLGNALLALLVAPSAALAGRSLDAYRGPAAWIDRYDADVLQDPWPALSEIRGHGVRTVFLETGPSEAAIYARECLCAGARINGPAILTQLDATTLLLPGQSGVVDRFGNLIVEERA